MALSFARRLRIERKSVKRIDESIVPWIGKTGKLIRMYLDAELQKKGFDLTVKQWLVLKKLSEKPGLMQSELAFLTDRNKTSLTRLIKTMENKDLVMRKSDALDGRAKRIFMSLYGAQVFDESIPLISLAFDKIQAGVSSSDMQLVRQVLTHIQQNIGLNIYHDIQS